MSKRVLELGSYVVPAYAGMVLAEQGHHVTKWVKPGADPILGLHRGDELWRWINHGKRLEDRHPRDLLSTDERWDIVIDNFRPSTLAKWSIDPARIAKDRGLRWVSLRSEVGEVSFDLIAQARSWMEFCPWVPFYVGDTVAGLWVAFKALAGDEPGHFVIGHATCMQKLVEGELVIDVDRRGDAIPWDQERYTCVEREAVIDYRGTTYREPARSREWKLAHLWHHDGRMVI